MSPDVALKLIMAPSKRATRTNDRKKREQAFRQICSFSSSIGLKVLHNFFSVIICTFICNFFLSFFFLLYSIVLVLPYINMNPPQVYSTIFKSLYGWTLLFFWFFWCHKHLPDEKCINLCVHSLLNF